MRVTEVRISPTGRGGKVRAFASIVIDDCFIVNDLRVVEGREGQVFVTMPARKARNGQLRDIAHPLNSETRLEVERRVLEEYDEAVKNVSVTPTGGGETGKGGGRQSFFDRLASRLFSEDFWVAESSPREDEKE